MPQYSMVGSRYAKLPSGQFPQETRILSDLIYQNPNLNRATNAANRQGQGVTRGYLAEGLPYDLEGLGNAVALKYGREASEKLMEAIPYMNRADLIRTIKEVGIAGEDADSMDQRERQAYERAGMEYVSGAYRPKHNGQIP